MIYFLNGFLELLTALAYRLRGGGFISFGSNWPGRAIFGASLWADYLGPKLATFDLYYGLAILPLAMLAMLVPHAYAQNMGRWPTPQKGWPAFFLPTLTDAEWAALPGAFRTLYDFFGMAGAAFFRAAIVFGPSLLSAHLQHGQIDPTGVLRASLVLTFGQPLAYVVGWNVPFSIGGSLTKYSTEWAEFLNGVVWAIAVAVL